jgi:hypothetical protein
MDSASLEPVVAHAPPHRGSAPMALTTFAVTPKVRGQSPRTPLVLVYAKDTENLVAPHGLEP